MAGESSLQRKEGEIISKPVGLETMLKEDISPLKTLEIEYSKSKEPVTIGYKCNRVFKRRDGSNYFQYGKELYIVLMVDTDSPKPSEQYAVVKPFPDYLLKDKFIQKMTQAIEEKEKIHPINLKYDSKKPIFSIFSEN